MPEKPATFVPFTDEELCRLEDTFGRIVVATGKAPAPRAWRKDDAPVPPWQAVFAQPTPAQANRFEAAANADSPGAKAAGVRDFALDTIVGLSRLGTKTIADDRGNAGQKEVRAAWTSLREVEGFPGAHLAAQSALMDLHGMTSDDAGKD